MLDILDSTKELYMTSSHKNLTIRIPGKSLTITNVNIDQEKCELSEILESENELQFKGCNSTMFKFSTAGMNFDIRDQYIEAEIQAENSEVIPLFHGYVVSQNNRTYEDVITEVECYDVLDKIRNLDVTAWYTSLQSTRTIKQIRDSFFSYLSTQYGYTIEQESVTLINDSLNVKKMSTAKLPKVLNAGYILECICQANARFGQIGRDGKFHYRELKIITKGLYPSYETFPSYQTFPSGENADIGYGLDAYSKISYEPYEVAKITGVSIIDNEGVATSVGTAVSPFIISDNIIAQTFSSKSTAAQNIYDDIKGIWYIPYNIECRGYPWVECGDALYTSTRRNVVRSFILKRTLKGVQAMFDTLEAKGNQFREQYVESTETGVSTNRNNVKEVADDLHTHYLTADYITTYYITAQQISASYASITSLEAVDAKFSNLDADNIKTGSLQLKYINGWDASNNRLVIPNLQVSNSFNINQGHGVTIGGGTPATWQSATISGTTIYYLGRTTPN